MAHFLAGDAGKMLAGLRHSSDWTLADLYPKERAVSEPHIIKGLIEDGRCCVDVMFGAVGPSGYTMSVPPVRAVLDTGAPGITLPKSIADGLPVRLERKPGAPPYPALATVVYCLYGPDGERLWQGEAKAMVVDASCQPTLGMRQLMQWSLKVDGPAGEFELTVPVS